MRTEVETSRYSCKKHSCRSMVLVRFYSDGKEDSFVLVESMQKSTIEANSKSQSLPSKNASKFLALDCVDGCLYIFSRLLTFHLVSLTFDMVWINFKIIRVSNLVLDFYPSKKYRMNTEKVIRDDELSTFFFDFFLSNAAAAFAHMQ